MKTPLATLALILCCAAIAQQHQNDPQYPKSIDLGSAPAQIKVAIDDVIKLSRAGVSDDVIIQQLTENGQRFDLSTNDLIQLKNAGVSDRVVQVMLDPTKTTSKPAQKPPGSTQPAGQSGGKGPSPGPTASTPSTQAFTATTDTRISSDDLHAQQWASSRTSDPLTGKSYMLYVLTGKYLAAPTDGSSSAPLISLRCDPSPHHKLSGRLIAGFVDVGTVIDIESGHEVTVKYRLDDGKVQTASRLEVGYSTDYQAIALEDTFLNNLLWGHMITHKPHSSGQVHKVVISVREHLDGNVVMQFDMPDAEEVGAACGTEYR